ncbi:30S ribosomal protein S8 [Candidatus Peregrinibacteria bacterium]|nr:30S ribosomal protein S8 [Candidatus Peregrinibacteria bacterium]
MTTDPIADYLTRLRNASRVKQEKTRIPYSKLKEQITKVLLSKKFIQGYEVKAAGKFKELVITLNSWTREPLHLKRISKPGQRIHFSSKNLPKIKSGLGLLVVSTPKGVMAGYEARKQNVGGEVLCEIY